MRERLKNISRIALATFASLLCLAPFFPAQAQGLGGVSYSSFGSDISVNADSSFDVIETIKGSFLVPRHGIFRFIPVTYDRPGLLPLQIFVHVDDVTMNGQSLPYDVSRSGAFLQVKIGDPDRTVSGPFQYQIRYRVKNAMLFHEAEDELYWNVTGEQWDAPIRSVTATVHVAGATADQIHGDCFQGAFGSTAKCPQTITDGTYAASGTGPITVSVRFPKGIVHEPSGFTKTIWWLADHWDAFVFLLIPLAVVMFLFRQWWIHGRDPKGRGVIVAQYEPPDDLHPAELSTLTHEKFQPRDFSATIVDLAVRGYVTIVEEKSDGLFAKTSYRFKRMKPADHHLRSFELITYDALLGSGDEATLDARRTALTTARERSEDAVYASVTDHGYYVKDPNKTRSKYVFLGILIIGVSFLLGDVPRVIFGHPTGFHLALLATGIAFLVFSPFMPKKTKKGAETAELGLGFKEYLEKAEKYRVQWQEKEGIFESFLPYAMVFGVADKWAMALAEQATVQPGWYVGNYGNWSAADFGDRITSFSSSMAMASAPKSSGGGGGGGFSGGGFGGGGGGSW